MSDRPQRRPARVTRHALVTGCTMRTKAGGDVWSGRRHMFVSLTCGHQVLKTGFRRFLVGERVRCKECERIWSTAQLELPGVELHV